MSNQAGSHISRITNTSSTKRKRLRLKTQRFSHHDQAVVDQWVAFMATAGWTLAESHTNTTKADDSEPDLISVTVSRYA